MEGRDPARDPTSLAALMRRRDPLFPLIYEFNLLPSRYMHASWADELFTPDLWERLRQSSRAEPHINGMILDDLGVGGTFPTTFDTPAMRLALVDGETLERLSLHLGMVMDGTALRTTIAGDAVRQLRETLGAESYLFAVQNAPLLARIAPAAPSASASDTPDLPLVEHLRSVGMALIGSAMAGLPKDIFKRFRLKLPRATNTDFILSDGAARALTLTTRVLKETEPRWASLFAKATA